MPPLKCKGFASASWVHAQNTGLTASTVNVTFHTKHENKRRSLYCARPPATKSPFLLMTSRDTTSPTLHYQNQPPDTGSVYESQRRKLWLSRHRSHRHTWCVCFCLQRFTIFRGEKRRSLYCSSSSLQKSVSVDDKQNNNPSTSLPEPNS